jgi:hypothetical protein
LEHKEHKEHKAHKDLKVIMVPKEHKEPRGLKELKEDFTGHTTAAAGDLEVAAELALEDSILVTELLFFSKSD